MTDEELIGRYFSTTDPIDRENIRLWLQIKIFGETYGGKLKIKPGDTVERCNAFPTSIRANISNGERYVVAEILNDDEMLLEGKGDYPYCKDFFKIIKKKEGK